MKKLYIHEMRTRQMANERIGKIINTQLDETFESDQIDNQHSFPSGLDESDIDIGQLVSILVKRKGLIVLVAVLVLVASLLSSLSHLPTYRASSTIKIMMEGDKLAHFDNAIEEGSLPGLLFFNAQLELLKSQALAKRVLAKLPASLPASIQKNNSLFSLSSIQHFFTSNVDNITSFLTHGVSKKMTAKEGNRPEVLSLIQNISIDSNKSKKNGHTIVKVHFTSIDPEYAATVLNTLVEEFILMGVEKKQQQSEKALKYFEEQLLLAKASLEQSEVKLVSYSREKKVFHESSDKLLVSDSVNILNKAYIAAKKEVINAKSAYLQRKQLSHDKSMNNSVVLQGLKQQKSKLENSISKGFTGI